MPDVTTSANVDTLMQSATFATFRTSLGLTALATTTPGTGIATALAVNVGSAGAPILFNGAAGTPSSMVGTNITGTAAGLTAGVASAVANGGSLGTSPSITTSLTTGSTTFALLNATATTVNAFGATTTLNIGASAATVLNFGGFTSAAELRFLEPSGSGTNYSGLKQPALAASITYLLPADAPANGDVLTSQTDGTLSWEPQSGAANAVTAASGAASSGLFWVSAGADRTATATDTVSTINATNANVTNFLPVSNDGAAIGASGTAFSDLFLASGAVINFNAGNLTLTHSAGTLTSNGAYVGTTATLGSATSLLLGTAGSAVGSVGFRNATSGAITVAPTTGALGTVTQTLQAVTGTILCTGGTDVPVADGGTGLSSGTSGGVLAFTASGTIASSGALAANAIVIGGGAGAAPSTTTTGTGVLTQLALAANGSAVDGMGFRGAPQNSQTAAYTTVMADAGKCIFHPSSDNNARTFTIDSNANVAYPIGTIMEFLNMAAASVTIAITSDTLTLLPAGTTGSRTLAQYGRASVEKISSTAWVISGNSALT